MARSASLNVNSRRTKSASGGTICKAQGETYEDVVPGTALFNNLHRQSTHHLVLLKDMTNGSISAGILDNNKEHEGTAHASENPDKFCSTSQACTASKMVLVKGMEG